MRPVLASLLLVSLAACGGASNPGADDSGVDLDDATAAGGGEIFTDAGANDTGTSDAAPTSSPPESDASQNSAPVDTSAPLPADIEPKVAEPPAAEPPATEPLATFLPPEAEVIAHGLGELTYDLPACPESPRGAVTDKANQRYWLCMDGLAVTDEIPMTTASSNYGLPPVGTYEVFARDEDAFGISGEALERFVAFYTTPKGNRIAFHEVVNQDPDTVGDLDQRGASAGCFRVREADSIQVWDFLQIGDPVVVLTN